MYAGSAGAFVAAGAAVRAVGCQIDANITTDFFFARTGARPIDTGLARSTMGVIAAAGAGAVAAALRAAVVIGTAVARGDALLAAQPGASLTGRCARLFLALPLPFSFPFPFPFAGIGHREPDAGDPGAGHGTAEERAQEAAPGRASEEPLCQSIETITVH